MYVHTYLCWELNVGCRGRQTSNRTRNSQGKSFMTLPTLASHLVVCLSAGVGVTELRCMSPKESSALADEIALSTAVYYPVCTADQILPPTQGWLRCTTQDFTITVQKLCADEQIETPSVIAVEKKSEEERRMEKSISTLAIRACELGPWVISVSGFRIKQKDGGTSRSEQAQKGDAM